MQNEMNASKSPIPTTDRVEGDSNLKSGNSSISVKSKQTTREHLINAEDSIKLQGGDIHRSISKCQEAYESSSNDANLDGKLKRSHTATISLHKPSHDLLKSMKMPNGMRRDYFLSNKSHQKTVSTDSINRLEENPLQTKIRRHTKVKQRYGVTDNFFEFLSVYGHYFGENLEEDEEGDEAEDWNADLVSESGESSESVSASSNQHEDESTALLNRKPVQKLASDSKTTMILLKSFIGTGILFLPKSFANGGALFSPFLLFTISLISLYCCSLLIRIRLQYPHSYADIAGILFGSWFRGIVYLSIVLSQIGFICAYTIFVADNWQAIITTLSHHALQPAVIYLVLIQALILGPLCFVRNIPRFSFIAVIADVFIAFSVIIILFFVGRSLAVNGASNYLLFNKYPNLTLGTCIFTFEGIGVLIPINESMKHPSHLPRILAWVTLGCCTIYSLIAILGYMAYGSATNTIILMNLPQESPFVVTVQILYSIAILLSVPLQFFPCIRIIENIILPRSGKHHPITKWKKNIFRMTLVLFTSVISWLGSSNLDNFVSLVGSALCIPLIYIFPPLLYHKGIGQTKPLYILFDGFLIIFGIFTTFYLSYITISQWNIVKT